MNCSKNTAKPMVYDCFLFFNELELLEIRLNELKDVVDYHVLVESKYTFQGKEKPCFQPLFLKESLQQFGHKIIRVIAEELQPTPWENEFFQRNNIRRALVDCSDHDLIMISDVDEIPSARAVAMYKALPVHEVRAFKQMFCYYKFNCMINSNWSHAKILPYSELVKFKDVQELRDFKCEAIHRGGWHFSYLGNPDRIVEKIQSFSHTELNQPFFTDKERLKECIAQGIDFIMPRQLKFVPLDDKFPKFLLENQDRFAEFIHQ